MQNKKDFPVLLALILAIVIINLLIPKNLEATIYGSISGQVFTEDTGKGLKDVKVYLFEQNSGRYPDEKTTDKKGRFSFDLVEEGEYILAFITDWHTGYYIDIDATRYIPGKEIIKLKKGQHIEVKIKALLGGAIRARLRKRDGTLFVPLPDKAAHILFYGEPLEGKILMEVPDKPGEFFVNAIPPAVYRFEARIEGHAIRELENVKVEKGKTTEIEFSIDLSDPTGIEGKVISAVDGEPIRAEHLSVYRDEEKVSPFHMWTDENGYFSIVGLSPGRYMVFCRKARIKDILVVQGEKTWVNIEIEDSILPSSNLIQQKDTRSEFADFFLSLMNPLIMKTKELPIIILKRTPYQIST